MKMLITLCAMAALALSATAATQKDTRCYEMRIYYAAEGKLADLEKRFRDHTVKLFAKHGMENIGYWVPVDNKENKLIYVLAYPNREAREKSWKSFSADPDWKAAHKASEVNGRLVARAETIFLEATDFSPAIKPSVGSGERIFELREYTASSGNLKHLDARFRDHTVALFAKHGMENIAYWHFAEGHQDADKKLIYIIAHKSREAARESFGAFGKDQAWVEARKASEKNAGGSLTAPGGVKSTFMKATDYSPTR